MDLLYIILNVAVMAVMLGVLWNMARKHLQFTKRVFF